MSHEKNIETLLEVVRNQQGIISELQAALNVSDFEHIQTENRFKDLERRVEEFVELHELNDHWKVFNDEQSELIRQIIEEGEY